MARVFPARQWKSDAASAQPTRRRRCLEHEGRDDEMEDEMTASSRLIEQLISPHREQLLHDALAHSMIEQGATEHSRRVGLALLACRGRALLARTERLVTGRAVVIEPCGRVAS